MTHVNGFELWPRPVIAGLDPPIHPLRKMLLTKRMDPRVKPAGDTCARGARVHQHHLPSPESASAARRRLASMAATRACALLIQVSAGARASGGSCANSETAPAMSLRETFASARATIAPASL